MEFKREIIYVDAGSINSDNFKICLYHMNSNKIHVMELRDIPNSGQAERYAIYYAILYIQKNGYINCMILSDHKGAIQDKILSSLLKDLNIQLIWIPREINQIADKNCKLPSTLDSMEFNTLNFFVELSKKAYNQGVLQTSLEMEKLKKENDKLKTKVKNQAQQLKSKSK